MTERSKPSQPDTAPQTQIASRPEPFLDFSKIPVAPSSYMAKIPELPGIPIPINLFQIQDKKDSDTYEPTTEELTTIEKEENQLPTSEVINEILEQNLHPKSLLKLYLQEACQKPSLSLDEEKTKIAAIATGRLASRKIAASGKNEQLKTLVVQGNQAKKDLIFPHTSMVVSIANKYQGYGTPFIDLIQSGNIGLIRALHKFDPAQRKKFSTYAYFWIKKEILDELNSDKRFYLSKYEKGRIRKIKKAINSLLIKSGTATLLKISEETKMHPEEIVYYLLADQGVVHMDKNPSQSRAQKPEVGNEDDHPDDFYELIPNSHIKRPTEIAALNNIIKQQNQRLMENTLTPLEELILKLRGLQNKHDKYSSAKYLTGTPKSLQPSFQDVGNKVGIPNRFDVRTIERKAQRKLQELPFYRELHPTGNLQDVKY